MLNNLFGMLAQLRIEERVTIVIVEQNAVQSLAISDRGVVLALGRVAVEDAAASLLADERVAELYLGGAVETLVGVDVDADEPEQPEGPADVS